MDSYFATFLVILLNLLFLCLGSVDITDRWWDESPSGGLRLCGLFRQNRFQFNRIRTIDENKSWDKDLVKNNLVLELNWIEMKNNSYLLMNAYDGPKND